MKKALVACATAATIAAAALAPTHAEARGGAVAAGIIGGLALGAIIGSAAAQGPYYAPGPAYYGPGPGCSWQTQRVWDGYGWRFNRVRVCY